METLLIHPHHQAAASRCSQQDSSRLELGSASRFLRISPVNPINGRGQSRPRQLLMARAAKGKRRYGPGVPQQKGIPSFPKIEDDGNPKFVVFVRDKRVSILLPYTRYLMMFSYFSLILMKISRFRFLSFCVAGPTLVPFEYRHRRKSGQTCGWCLGQ